MTHQSDDSNTASNAGNTRAQFLRRSSSRMGSTSIRSESFRNADGSGNGPPGQNLRPQISRRNSTRFPTQSESSRRERSLNIRDDDDNDDSYNDDDSAREGTRRLPEERSLSAREAVVAQETAEAAAAAAAAAADEEESEDTPLGSANSSGEPVRMSLMDLLEETDRQMGLEGSRYIMDEEEEDEEEEEAEEEDEGGVEYNCCVCMVRHKGSAFIPCGHTFCRLCSRELFVSRGNCPLCNGFILEILDIF
ncbi:putative RING/U-box superfamily protein [Quillaja saponaria]|uniref:RING/U-box superfamily protein n=1 Tax=Quillaja saponaria TaxID=32244 RepID=A0AAD7PCV7_QUISA|nr:putative RING/U-box superfamily protein [Quillaja saponaria]